MTSYRLKEEENAKPKLTVLSFSGGTGSGAIMEMVLRGHIPRPDPFIVINADPGMENSNTYIYIDEIEQRCKEDSIPFIRIKRNLYEDIINLKASGIGRLDSPPFWTKNRETGKRGKLLQRCTQYYKIRPMDQVIRIWMEENLGISRKSTYPGKEIVCKWIGFSADEWMRIKEPVQKYAYFEYPLIDMKITKAGIAGYYRLINKPLPKRSVCNACFANDVMTFKEMSEKRPADFEQACLVDDVIRDLTCIGVRDECYVSSTLIGLREMKARNFLLDSWIIEKDTETCHSGHCFV